MVAARSQGGRRRRRYGSNVELRVLGGLQACAPGRVIELRPVERRLLAALAVRRPDAVRYDALAEAVWGDAVPRSATRSLQTHVLRVRSVAGGDAVETVSGGYRLGATVSLDVVAFTALFKAAGASDDRRAALAAWDETLALWRGIPFEELEDWPPAIAERARLTEMWQRALEERCAVALGVLSAADVVAEAEALVQAEPLRERRWSLLLSSLDAAGRRAEALRAFDRARRVLATELGISPGHELNRLHETLLRDGDHLDDSPTASPRSARPNGNLPAPLTTIIGRDGQIERVAEMLTGARLITLTGAGGIGKTRLALAVGETIRNEVSGGVWIVELARTHEPDTVDALIAAALGLVTSGPQTVRDTVLGAIGDRQLVLVLDNCEHVLAPVADFIVAALGHCGRLRVLTTSREPLAVPGERTMVVPSLATDGAAAELFIARARDADPAFTGDDSASVAAITRHLDGIPLAIELAAARVRTIGLGEMVRHLDDRSDLVTARGGGRDERHRTMRAALDWSYELLDDAERLTFEQLSVFRGRFELEAVPRVVDGLAGDQDVSAVLASLVDKSMVLADGADPARFRMLEPLRQYAAARLSRTGRAEIVATRHAHYYSELATRLDDQLGGRDEVIAARRIDAARDNLRAAFHTASRDSDVANALAIGVALTGYARTRIWSEPWSWCEAALTLPGAADHPLRRGRSGRRERRCLAARRPPPQCGARRRGHRPRRAGQPRMASTRNSPSRRRSSGSDASRTRSRRRPPPPASGQMSPTSR